MGGRASRQNGLSMEDVQKHTSKDDAWLVLFGEALDVSKFIGLHPGGEDSITAYLGKDATADWEMIHSPDAMEKYVQFITKKGKIAALQSGGFLSWLWRNMGSSRDSDSKAIPKATGITESAPEDEPTAGAEASSEGKEPVRWSALHESELPPGGVFDLNELARWNGVDLPMCISICGVVVDVSSSDNFVPDFGYGKLWAGKETTWAMATVSLKAHDANKFDFKVEELSEDHFNALAGWYKHFLHKYRKVGTLHELRNWDFSSIAQAAEALPVSGMSKSQ